MTQPDPGPEAMDEIKLPLRDWFWLPLLSLLTIGLLAVSVELIAMRMFSETKTGVEKCQVFTDPTAGVMGIPNSTCWEKDSESPPIEYRFNSSGFRADLDFGPKLQDTYRIVMVGSSTAMGLGVPISETFGALLPQALSQRTGRKVELFNEAIEGWGGSPRKIATHLDEILALKPDMILWVLGPGDVTRAAQLLPPPDAQLPKPLTVPERAWRFAKAAVAQFIESATNTKLQTDTLGKIIGSKTRTAILLRHFLFRSQSLYVRAYFVEGNHTGKTPEGESESQSVLQSHLQILDTYANDIETRAKAAGVPVVAVFMPNRGAQATMISMGKWPAGYDPYMLDNQLRGIIISHGGTYIDILPYFQTVPNPEWGYFPLNAHPNADGHATISSFLAKELTGGAIPELKADKQPQTALAQRR